MAERTQQSRRAARASDPAPGVQVAGPRHRQLTQLATALNAAPRPGPAAAATARSGNADPLPAALKNGVEALSGLSMDHVRVHFDSARPAQFRAHAYAQGGDIHLSPGQQRHLPHEAWHVVQQAQGRVKPTAQLKGNVPVNDDAGLEREAEAMGARALAMPARREGSPAESPSAAPGALQAKAVVQRAVWEYTDDGWEVTDGEPDAEPPMNNGLVVGMVYDDAYPDTFFKDHDAWVKALRAQVVGSDDFSDDDMDSDYTSEDEERDYEEHAKEEDEEEDEDVEDPSGSDASEMDIEERRDLDAKARRRPLETSLLNKPAARFPSRTMASAEKFKAGGVMGQRTQQSGPVTITLQTVGINVQGKLEMRERPISISGIVETTVTTGRGGAPDPLSGVQIYMGKGAQPKASVKMERNSGIPDAERGHVMALELGGPDIPQNIVPQWAKFQGSGEWRRMEVAVLAKAEALPKGQRLRYSVEIFYKDSGTLTPTLRTFGFPTGFKATTQVIDGKKEGPKVVEFHQGQAQDQTDQMLSEREMGEAEGPDWDPALNITKDKGSTGKQRKGVKARKVGKTTGEKITKKAASDKLKRAKTAKEARKKPSSTKG